MIILHQQNRPNLLTQSRPQISSRREGEREQVEMVKLIRQSMIMYQIIMAAAALFLLAALRHTNMRRQIRPDKDVYPDMTMRQVLLHIVSYILEFISLISNYMDSFY